MHRTTSPLSPLLHQRISVDSQVQSQLADLKRNIEAVILGKSEVVECLLAALLARGHVLIEDVPGVGKTTLARTLARSIDCQFKRIQFTPDLLPSDITGLSVFDSEKREFLFKPGPIFTHILLADEINRSTPRTQSALLEAMNDCQVTVDGTSHPLEMPFMVIATQNPLEYAGTYPLPESQLDRFLMRLHMGYPARSQERAILASPRGTPQIESVRPTLHGRDVVALWKTVEQVRVDESICEYMLSVVEASRSETSLMAGVSPRGSSALYRAAQAMALLRGRDFVVPDDVKMLVIPVLAHRVIPKTRRVIGDGRATATVALEGILKKVRSPG